MTDPCTDPDVDLSTPGEAWIRPGGLRADLVAACRQQLVVRAAAQLSVPPWEVEVLVSDVEGGGLRMHATWMPS